MTLSFLRPIYIIYTFVVFSNVALAQTRSNIENTNDNELKVCALLNLSDPDVTNGNSDRQLVLSLPSNGDIVYGDIQGQNIERGSRIFFPHNTPPNSHAT